MTEGYSRTLTTRMFAAFTGFGILAGAAWFPPLAAAQGARVQVPQASKPATDSTRMADMADHAMGAMGGVMDENMMKHMEMTPGRTPTRDDSVRATRIVAELKQGISKYQDTATAVADGFKMFLPDLKTQKVFHFTNYGHAFKEAFRFNPAEPTSLLYERRGDGKLHLIGAMYTLGKNASLDRLNDRVPLSIAHWHKHVNWCLPKKGDQARWSEQKNGKPLFGPESPVATKAECDAIKGDFHPNVFGWMLHANVFEGTDLSSIFADDHGGSGMKTK